MGRHVTSTPTGNVPISNPDDCMPVEVAVVVAEAIVAVVVPVAVVVVVVTAAVAVAVRVYTPGGSDGNKQDHSYALTYTPTDEGMTVGVEREKEETGDEDDAPPPPTPPVFAHEQVTGVTGEVPRREMGIHEPPLHTLLAVLIGSKSDQGVRSVVTPSVRGEGTIASTKLDTSPGPDAIPKPCPSPDPEEVGVAEGRGPVEATRRTPTGEKS